MQRAGCLIQRAGRIPGERCFARRSLTPQLRRALRRSSIRAPRARATANGDSDNLGMRRSASSAQTAKLLVAVRPSGCRDDEGDLGVQSLGGEFPVLDSIPIASRSTATGPVHPARRYGPALLALGTAARSEAAS